MKIFKSHQVNIDPEPWKSLNHGGRGATALVYDDMKYSPRPEFEPTRDPEPYVREDGWRERKEAKNLQGRGYGWAPRREEFDTPVNQALVDFRRRYVLNGTRDDAAEWLETGIDPWHYTPEEIKHAQKVLSRLVDWGNNE